MSFIKWEGSQFKDGPLVSKAIRNSAKGQTCTIQSIVETFSYDPDTGFIIRKSKGTVVGSKNSNGYLVISHKGKMLYAHRIAWVLYYGKWPKGVIDHINHSRKDNRIRNLRDVNNSENLRNLRRAKNNKSGITGVRYNTEYRLWEARITGEIGRTIFLGRYETLPEASAARNAAEIILGYGVRGRT